ncbi:Pycsar system effector family protein [Amycolatopsis sp. CA-230715]|uniref:Pycsar system effector family protein n=1 Tax=Amycolatopsis sp. CA-230715 TaxID=2745196 RepID=UPI001C034D96|nr:Pycsar system effector family protein [Amycolatopsis sp. CA-230715]QWF80450.1 hypothetical protein HUW46_03872 [Amycolatopsis sp. CA-230715]
MSAAYELPFRVTFAHEQAQDELRRADTKATTLLGLVGVGFAGVIALTSRAVSVPAAVAFWFAAVPVLAAVLFLLGAIRPRIGQYPPPGTWLHATYHGPAALLEANSPAVAEALADHVCVLGRVAVEKYARIRRSVSLLFVGVGVLAVGLALSVLT